MFLGILPACDKKKNVRQEQTPCQMDAPATATDSPSPPTVNALTVLFNAVEIANRRGAYSLKESAMISRALDAVRQVNPETAPAEETSTETPAAEGAAAAEEADTTEQA